MESSNRSEKFKVAAFNRYQSLDVARALADSGRHTEVALYTGNDDNIVSDLLTEFRFPRAEGLLLVSFSGWLAGTLGGVDKTRGRVVERSAGVSPRRWARRFRTAGAVGLKSPTRTRCCSTPEIALQAA